jgi:ribose transport system substrate-binding protein
MKRILWVSCGSAALAISGLGCSDSSDTAEKKEITRVEVPESPFKPTELEATIEGLVDSLRDTEDQSFEMSVVTKPFGGYWEPVKVGANRAMAELNLDGQVEAPVEDDNPDVTEEDQIAMLEQRHSEGYGGIGLAPYRDSVADEVNKLVDDGVPVVTLDSDLADSKRQLYVGTNNGEAGKTAGATLANLLEGSVGSVLILGYDQEDWPDGYARSQGAKEVLEDAGFTVSIHKIGWSEEEIASDNEVLPDKITNADPPLVGILGMFSNAYRGAEMAEQLGYEPGELKMAGFDFEPQTLAYMEGGYIQATHVQRQYYMGYLVPYALYSIRVLGMDATIDSLADQMIDTERFDTGIDVVQADQVDDYNDFLDTLEIGG